MHPFIYHSHRFLLLLLLASPVLAERDYKPMTEEEIIQKLLSIQIPPEKSKFMDIVDDFNRGFSNDLAFAEEAMQPDIVFTEEEKFTAYDKLFHLVIRLKIDERTEPLFERILREGENDWIRNKIIWRIDYAVSEDRFTPSDSLIALLEGFAVLSDENIKNYTRVGSASTSALKEIRKQQARKTSLLGRIKSLFKDKNDASATNESHTEPVNTFVSDTEKPATNGTEETEEAATPSAASSDETDNPLSTWWLWLIAVGCVVGICGWAIRRK